MGLATVIGRENKDSSGHQLEPSVNASIKRLRTWDFRSQVHSSAHRNLIQAFSELGRLRDKLGLSDAIMEKAAYYYRKAQERHLVRGRSISSLLAAAVYAACREGEASRTLNDISKACDVRRKAISRSYRILVTELDIRVPLVDPIKCIARIANGMKLTEKTKRISMTTLNDLNAKGVSAGKNPMGLAAAILYMSCIANDEGKTQKAIADASGVTEVTIRNRIKDLKARLKLEENSFAVAQ
jgi:transcription initiation factor TFIIB